MEGYIKAGRLSPDNLINVREKVTKLLCMTSLPTNQQDCAIRRGRGGAERGAESYAKAVVKKKERYRKRVMPECVLEAEKAIGSQ